MSTKPAAEQSDQDLPPPVVVSLSEGEFVTYYGPNNEWRLFRAKDGIIIGYRSKKNKEDKTVDVVRLVTTTKNPDEFGKFVEKHTKRMRRYNPYKDPNQLRLGDEP